MNKIQLSKVIFLMCFWVLCTLFIATYDSILRGFENNYSDSGFGFVYILVTAVLITVLGSFLLATIEVFYLSRLLQKKPFGFSLVVKTFIYLLFILVFNSIAIIFMIAFQMDASLFHRDVLLQFSDYLISWAHLFKILYWGGAIAIAMFILQVSDKFGQGILINFLSGKYHRPKEEDRIFMFMDLKSSTTYAEQLGHIKYSRFIQDCFFDITEVITRYKAQIYQYVGDEVVLFWKTAEGLKNGNCIRPFFEYDSLLKKKSKYYETVYGVNPEFKAGIHMGTVTAAEVGIIKKELAFHGDVINTAARIQGRCNDLKRNILLSETMKLKLEPLSIFLFDHLGSVVLKGKEKPVNLYGVTC